eukprot:UN30074
MAVVFSFHILAGWCVVYFQYIFRSDKQVNKQNADAHTPDLDDDGKQTSVCCCRVSSCTRLVLEFLCSSIGLVRVFWGFIRLYTLVYEDLYSGDDEHDEQIKRMKEEYEDLSAHYDNLYWLESFL